MTIPSLHERLTFERRIAAPRNLVYQAFADLEQRARWSTLSSTASFAYDHADFRAGGEDLFRCGGKTSPAILRKTLYHFIDPPSLIVSSESLRMNDRFLSASLNTIALLESHEFTAVTQTIQLVSLAGPDMVKGYMLGTSAALDNLRQQLEASQVHGNSERTSA